VPTVKFGELPPPKGSENTPHYDQIAQALRLEPGEWGQIAVVTDRRELERLTQALRKRGLRVARRTCGKGKWTLWGMAPPGV
jgi:hypothetical protein